MHGDREQGLTWECGAIQDTQGCASSSLVGITALKENLPGESGGEPRCKSDMHHQAWGRAELVHDLGGDSHLPGTSDASHEHGFLNPWPRPPSTGRKPEYQ